jgi:hypothetical protein
MSWRAQNRSKDAKLPVVSAQCPKNPNWVNGQSSDKKFLIVLMVFLNSPYLETPKKILKANVKKNISREVADIADVREGQSIFWRPLDAHALAQLSTRTRTGAAVHTHTHWRSWRSCKGPVKNNR